jgi:hypothetical protein
MDNAPARKQQSTLRGGEHRRENISSGYNQMQLTSSTSTSNLLSTHIQQQQQQHQTRSSLSASRRPQSGYGASSQSNNGGQTKEQKPGKVISSNMNMNVMWTAQDLNQKREVVSPTHMMMSKTQGNQLRSSGGFTSKMIDPSHVSNYSTSTSSQNAVKKAMKSTPGQKVAGLTQTASLAPTQFVGSMARAVSPQATRFAAPAKSTQHNVVNFGGGRY